MGLFAHCMLVADLHCTSTDLHAGARHEVHVQPSKQATDCAEAAIDHPAERHRADVMAECNIYTGMIRM